MLADGETTALADWPQPTRASDASSPAANTDRGGRRRNRKRPRFSKLISPEQMTFKTWFAMRVPSFVAAAPDFPAPAHRRAARGLKGQFQTELENSRIVRVDRVQEGIAGEAIGSRSARGRIAHRRSAIATDHIVATVSRMCLIVNAELRVVENVECLGAKLKIALAKYAEMLQ